MESNAPASGGDVALYTSGDVALPSDLAEQEIDHSCHCLTGACSIMCAQQVGALRESIERLLTKAEVSKANATLSSSKSENLDSLPPKGSDRLMIFCEFVGCL